MFRRLILSLALVVCAFSGSVCAYAARLEKPYDHSLLDSFLRKYVDEAGEADFAAMKENSAPLDKYIAQLGKIDENDFLEWPREEKIAFWINAYHAVALAQILKAWPIKSVQDIPSIWDTKYLVLQQESYSLNEIRNSKLIGEFKDEKIHFALSSLSKTGPKLLGEAYTGPKIEGQLFTAARNFVNDGEKNKIIPGEKKIYLSKFFRWYAGDFSFNFGTSRDNEEDLSKEEFSVLSFIAYYLDDPAKIEYLEEKKYKIKYLPFDWSLNAQDNSAPAAAA